MDSGVLVTGTPLVIRDVGTCTKTVEVLWDGSFGEGAGIGITLGYRGEDVFATFAVPVFATDATRCEALGPALASLLLTRLPVGPVRFRGDSMSVVRLLR